MGQETTEGHCRKRKGKAQGEGALMVEKEKKEKEKVKLEWGTCFICQTEKHVRDIHGLKICAVCYGPSDTETYRSSEL